MTDRLAVFLAEDDEAFRTLLAERLRADGHEVIEASTGATLLFNLAVKGLQDREQAARGLGR